MQFNKKVESIPSFVTMRITGTLEAIALIQI